MATLRQTLDVVEALNMTVDLSVTVEADLKTAFISEDGNVVNISGENYYRACPEMVSEHQGCVKRVEHVTEHEDFYGNKKPRE